MWADKEEVWARYRPGDDGCWIYYYQRIWLFLCQPEVRKESWERLQSESRVVKSQEFLRGLQYSTVAMQNPNHAKQLLSCL